MDVSILADASSSVNLQPWKHPASVHTFSSVLLPLVFFMGIFGKILIEVYWCYSVKISFVFRQDIMVKIQMSLVLKVAEKPKRLLMKAPLVRCSHKLVGLLV